MTTGKPDPAGIHITALLPAHNEEVTIADAIASLQAQSRPPDRILVIADNCTDRTPQIARASGAEVLETVANRDKKAGGLNQALGLLLPEAADHQVFLVMDADTVLSPRFLEVAEGRLTENPDYGAIGGLFFGEDGGGLIGALQRNEYFRYQREVRYKGGRVMVLSGTASVFRATALRDVAQARGSALPGTPGKVYDTLALTEDNELTVALKTLGWGMVSPQECRTVTEVMPDWRSLWRQRERWQRGALENLRNYGLTQVTRTYWRQQLGITYGVIALQAYLILLVLVLLAEDTWAFYPFWLGISAVFVIERVSSVWRGGWQARLIAAPLIIEILYDMFIQAVFVKAVWDFLRRKDADWNYVPREEQAQ